MSRTFRPLATLDALDGAVRASHTQPVVLFKHSRTCGTSAIAHEEMEALLDDPHLTSDVFILYMQGDRPVSDAIAARFKVRHESPQVLIISNGTVAWHGSHWNVTAARVLAQLQTLAAATSQA